MRILVFACSIIIGVAATLTSADAGSYRHHTHSRGLHSAKVAMHARGAFRGQPNTCWTDEGYGRRAPCSGRD